MRVESCTSILQAIETCSLEDSLIVHMDHPAMLGRPVTSQELRKIDDEIWGQ